MAPSESRDLPASGHEPTHEPSAPAPGRSPTHRRDPGGIRVRRVMRPVPEGIPPEATLREAEETMDRNEVNWLPVTHEGRCVGILTLQDIRQAQRPRVTPRA